MMQQDRKRRKTLPQRLTEMVTELTEEIHETH